MNITEETLSGFSLIGFKNPTFDATAVFRQTLNAMSRPGQIETLPILCDAPDTLNRSLSALLLALADMETKVWLSPSLNTEQAREYLSFQTGCQITDGVEGCQFAIIDAQTSVEVLEKLSIGTAEFPDRSATLIVLVEEMSNDASVTLRGPGIETQQTIDVGPLPDGFWQWFAQNQQTFPCGVDVIFASENQVSAVPRTIKVEV